MRKQNAYTPDTLEENAHNAARDHQMDNIRCLMLFFVVFGHLLEIFHENGLAMSIYRVIYTFHVLIFLSGYYARYRPKAMVRKLLFPYLLFQLLYIFFEVCVLHNEEIRALQFTKPYWLLWYLLALFFFTLLLPLFQTDDWHVAGRNLLILLVLSLATGFEDTIDYNLSLSRVLVFLPFFVTGHYCAVFSGRTILNRHRRMAAVCAAGIIVALEVLFVCLQVPLYVFYGALSYNLQDSNVLIRLLFLICASAWCVFFLSTVSGKMLRIITGIGQRTLPVYLLHGFVQRIILSRGLLQSDSNFSLLYAAGIAAFLLITLSAKPLHQAAKKLF